MTTPVVATIQYVLYSVSIPKKLIFSLIPVIIGVIIVTCNEVELRLWGFIYAVCGILSTSFYQVWVKTRQQDLQLSPPQLLYYQAPISACMVLILTPMFDQIFTKTTFPTIPVRDNGEQHNPAIGIASPEIKIGLLDYPLFENGYALLWILFSCLLAFCVNLSIFLTIGRTSPISYNVLGHFKLCVITIGGMFFFSEDMNDRKLVGIVIALVGITLYTYWKLQIGSNWDKREKQQQAATRSNNINNSINSSINNTKNDRNIQDVRIVHHSNHTSNNINISDELIETTVQLDDKHGINSTHHGTVNDRESTMKNC